MESPPLPPLSTTTTTPTATTAPANPNFQDSVDSSSSPRSRNVDTWDEPLPLVPGAKLRLMCSYGGHIIPRPHDKSLCYIGGETRIVAVDRHSTLADLCARLSRSLLNGRPFTLKYRLPHEDLDSLISVSTDEDLENMIEEYERMSSTTSPLKPSRLRLFLFFSKPETTASMGALVDDAKSETWFVDALNNSDLLPRNLSDSATMDCLLTLDRVVRGSDSCNDLQAQQVDSTSEHTNDQQQTMKNVTHEVVQTMSDSPMVLENSSSFGSSSSSSPSTANLPPIRVRVNNENEGRSKDQGIGIEEQFAHVSYAPPAIPTMVMTTSGTMVTSAVSNPATVSGEITNRVFSDDEKSDHGVSAGFRKPPLAPLQPVQHKAGAGFSLASPDSVASDTSSIASVNSLSKQMYYQDQVHVTHREMVSPPVNCNAMNESSDMGSGSQLQQPKGSNYVMPQQQQQFVHAIYAQQSPYYPIYAPQSQQQNQQFNHHPVDHHQQYPFYVMPIPQTQQHNLPPLQSNNIPNNNTNSATYKDGIPPVYPTKNASSAIPLVQIPSNQYQQQYMGFSQMHAHPSQSIPVANSATSNYGFEYPNNPSHEQVYYTQQQATSLSSQYQSMTPAAAAIALSDASKQMPMDQNNNQQQNRTSQPV